MLELVVVEDTEWHVCCGFEWVKDQRGLAVFGQELEAELPTELGLNVLHSLTSIRITAWTTWRRCHIFSDYRPYSMSTHKGVR